MTAQLPEAFINRLREIFPQAQFDELIRSFLQTKAVSFRVNTLKTNKAEVVSALEKMKIDAHDVAGFPDTFEISAQNKPQLTSSELFLSGDIYIQNLSSMLPPLILNPKPTDRVLDISSAPGSKTTQLAAIMQNQGWISAVEINKPRFYKLLDNIKQQGATNVHTYLMDGATVWQKCPEQFDKILVDAPCSSESRISALNPDSYAYWSEKKIQEMVKKQKRLLFSAVLSLKPGGELLYSTCSFAPEENEMAISKLMKKFSHALEIVPFELAINNWEPGRTKWRKKNLHPDVVHSKRILPTDSMDGFYLCKLRKTSSTLQK